ncbi:MAG: copper amine oxidase N-terminal domain-containing protein [Armatimonadota bacterium]|nr:copper amine oxidase N-terminal domain-containing protein [Armatimonadota bacterium]
MRLTTIVVALAVAAACWAADDIRLVANGKTIQCDTPPMLNEGRVHVPLRAAAQAIGADVEYSPQAKRVTICRGDICTFVMQSEGITVSGRLLLGIRQLGEALNAKVDWDGSTKTVRVTTTD